MGERGWEEIHSLIKLPYKSEMSGCGWEGMTELRRWQSIDRLVKAVSKKEMGESGGEAPSRLKQLLKVEQYGG